jgi:hypothetical protein
MEKIFNELRNMSGVINTLIINKNGRVTFGDDKNMAKFVTGVGGAGGIGILFKGKDIGDERSINTPQGELKILNGEDCIILILCDRDINIDGIKQILKNNIIHDPHQYENGDSSAY